MARKSAPPGPPPTNYRSPGAPPTHGFAHGGPVLGTGRPDIPASGGRSSSGLSGSAVAAIALGMLVVGLVFGFFLGRMVDDEAGSEDAAASLPRSTTTSRPPGGTIPQEPPIGDPGGNAPPSTDLDPTVIGTLEDPIPLGEPYITGVFELTVNGADFDATDTLADHDPANRTPEAGDRRVLVDVTLGFVDSTGVADTGFVRFNASDGSKTWSDLDAACGNVPESVLYGFLLGPDEEATGNVCFTVPGNEVDELYLTVDGFDGPIYFALR